MAQDMRISTILDNVETGAIQLPKFQRGYEWTRPRVRKFFTSLYRDFPVGNLMIWKTQAERVPIRTSKGSTPTHFELLLDGQQRVTTLYGIMRGETPAFFEDGGKSFPGFGLHFHLAEERFDFPSNKALASDDLWVDLTDLFRNGFKAESEVVRRLNESPNHREKLEDYDTRLRKVRSIPQKQITLDYVEDERLELEEIVEIFNAVNSGGQTLDAGDLALARMSVEWPDVRETLLSYSREWSEQNLDFSLNWTLLAFNVNATEQAEYDKIIQFSENQLKKGARQPSGTSTMCST